MIIVLQDYFRSGCNLLINWYLIIILENIFGILILNNMCYWLRTAGYWQQAKVRAEILSSWIISAGKQVISSLTFFRISAAVISPLECKYPFQFRYRPLLPDLLFRKRLSHIQSFLPPILYLFQTLPVHAIL